MIRKIAVKFILSIVALAVIAGLLMTVFRGPSAGGYRFATRYDYQDPNVPGDLAVVPKILPVVRLYGEGGESPLSLVLVPFAKLGVPLGRGVPIVHYDMTEDGTITLRPSSSSRPTRYLSRLPGAETQRRFQAWQLAHEQRMDELRRLAGIPATENGWVARLGGGPETLVFPDDHVYRQGGVGPLYVSQDSRFQLENAQGRPVPDLARQFHSRFRDYSRTDDDVFIAKTEDGQFVIETIRKTGNDTWLMSGHAGTYEAAARQVAIARSMRDDRQPLRIVGDDSGYLNSPVLKAFPEYQAQANKAFTDWLSKHLTPESVVVDASFLQSEIRLDGENDTGARFYNAFPIRLSLSDDDSLLKAEDGEVLAASDDGTVRFVSLPGTDYTPPFCAVEGRFPLLPAHGGKQLSLQISRQSASLPDCRIAAQVLAAFSKSGFAEKLDLGNIAPLSDYFGQFSFAEPYDDGLIILQRDTAGAVIRRTGETVIPLTENKRFSRLDDETLMGRSSAPEKSGLTLYDPEGRALIGLDYDFLSEAMAPQSAWSDIFETVKDERYGLYDLKHRREIAPARYDRFRFFSDLQLVLAYRGQQADLLTKDGDNLIPGGVSDYVFVDTAASPPPEDGFIAVKGTADGAWQFLTKKKVPLLDGTFSNVKRLQSPAGYAFELIGLDGSKRYIALTEEGRVEAIPAPR